MASTTNDYRLTNVTNEKNSALNEMNNTYNSMINSSQQYYDNLINNSKDWTDKQQAIQQANTNWAIDKIEQSKEQAEKDYIKEQKGAYTDYQKAIDEYGVNAEQRASTGMNNSGYTETAQMMAFNSYQNRYASAREDYNNAILNYNNGIKDAMLQNSSSLAQIAYEGLQSQLELALQGFQYKNELLQTQFNNKMSIESLYETKYNNVLNQINEENRLAEERRQFNAQLAASKKSSSSSLNGGTSLDGEELGGDKGEGIDLQQATDAQIKKLGNRNLLSGYSQLWYDSQGRVFNFVNGNYQFTGVTRKDWI